MKRILVTGATGLVGTHLCRRLKKAGYAFRGCVRTAARESDFKARLPHSDVVQVGDIDGLTDWQTALDGIDVVVHLAARVHQMKDNPVDSAPLYQRVNHEATANLAKQAAEQGVKQFLFLSTVKVYGEASSDTPFTEISPTDPQDPYAQSKLDAQQALMQIAENSLMHAMILQPPLIYGAGVKANFQKLMALSRFNIPLPLGGVDNQRSLLYVGNLVDVIIHAIGNSDAFGKTFLVSDGEPYSTPTIIKQIAKSMNKKIHLVNIPPSWLKMTGRLMGKSGAVDRLLSSLWIDSSRIQKDLNWHPPYTFAKGIQTTVDDFLKQGAS